MWPVGNFGARRKIFQSDKWNFRRTFLNGLRNSLNISLATSSVVPPHKYKTFSIPFEIFQLFPNIHTHALTHTQSRKISIKTNCNKFYNTRNKHIFLLWLFDNHKMRDKVLMGRWDMISPCLSTIEEEIFIIVYVYEWCLLKICCLLLVFWIFDIDGEFMGFQVRQEESKTKSKDDMRKCFSQLAYWWWLVLFMFVWKKFNFFPINFRHSTRMNEKSSFVSRPWGRGTWISFRLSPPLRSLNFILSFNKFILINVSISYMNMISR